VTPLFKDALKIWRGKRYQKEAADALGVSLSAYRKWEKGKRQPKQISMPEIERRMLANTDAA
jgi:transcriptional regulator with XRE-family HTH domain